MVHYRRVGVLCVCYPDDSKGIVVLNISNAKKWPSFRRREIKRRIGTVCDNLRCGNILTAENIQICHLVKRGHAPELYFCLRNLRFMCGCDRLDRKNGIPLTNDERIDMANYQFGVGDAKYILHEMKKRGFGFERY